MGTVFISISMTLDGYLAPAGMTLEHADDPAYSDWMAQWGALQNWALSQKFFRENLQLGEGGETGPENDLAERTYKRTGVTILGKTMFDGGERYWPEEAPFHTPVFVVTHTKREPWVRPGGTTFYFVNDGIEAALRNAREVVGDRDIRIGGGANVIVQFLNAGLVDELDIALAPTVFGSGVRLFDGIDRDRIGLELTDTLVGKRGTTHLTYRVSKPG